MPLHKRDPVRLERLDVRRYRHVARPVVLELGDGPVLLLGRNGTGKTNLLVLIDAVTRLDFSAFEDDPHGFDVSFRLRWEQLTLEMDLAWDPPVRGGPRRSRARYAGTARAASGEAVVFEVGPGKVRGGHRLAEDEEKPDPFEPRFNETLAWFLGTTPRQEDGVQTLDRWLSRLTFWFPWITSANGRFDEALESFRIITEAGDGHASLYIMDAVGESGISASPVGKMVPYDVAAAYHNRRAPERLHAVSDEIPWLAKAARACGFDRLEIQAHPAGEDRPTANQVDRTYAPFTWFAQRGSSRFPHYDFSFGQRRIVAAFWYLACVRDFGGVVVADELVNGLHHEALGLVLEQAEGLQGFLASQNPLLFDFMEYTTAEDFRTRIVRCDPEADGWAWRNPSEAEAGRFLEAYDQGYQHVSEILRIEELW